MNAVSLREARFRQCQRHSVVVAIECLCADRCRGVRVGHRGSGAKRAPIGRSDLQAISLPAHHTHEVRRRWRRRRWWRHWQVVEEGIYTCAFPPASLVVWAPRISSALERDGGIAEFVEHHDVGIENRIAAAIKDRLSRIPIVHGTRIDASGQRILEKDVLIGNNGIQHRVDDCRLSALRYRGRIALTRDCQTEHRRRDNQSTPTARFHDSSNRAGTMASSPNRSRRRSTVRDNVLSRSVSSFARPSSRNASCSAPA